MSCHFLLGRRASTELAKFLVPVPNNSVCVFYRPFQALHLQQHLPYVIYPSAYHTVFSACLILALLLFFPCGSPCPISVRGGTGGAARPFELKTSDGSLSNGQTPKLELRTFTIEMLNDGVHVSYGNRAGKRRSGPVPAAGWRRNDTDLQTCS